MRLPDHDKPGLGDAYWRRQKRLCMRRMAGFDDLPPDVREIVRATGTMPPANDDLAMDAVEPPPGERLQRRRRRE